MIQSLYQAFINYWYPTELSDQSSDQASRSEETDSKTLSHIAKDNGSAKCDKNLQLDLEQVIICIDDLEGIGNSQFDWQNGLNDHLSNSPKLLSTKDTEQFLTNPQECTTSDKETEISSSDKRRRKRQRNRAAQRARRRTQKFNSSEAAFVNNRFLPKGGFHKIIKQP